MHDDVTALQVVLNGCAVYAKDGKCTTWKKDGPDASPEKGLTVRVEGGAGARCVG